METVAWEGLYAYPAVSLETFIVPIQLSPAIELVAHGSKAMIIWGRMLIQNKQLCLILYILIHLSSRINLFRMHPGNVLLKNCNGTSKLLGRMLQTVTSIDSSLHPT